MDRKHFITLSEQDMNYDFLPSGDIYSFKYGNFMINQFRGNVKDGSVNNIYLRIYQNNRITAYPLLGIKSAGTVSVSKAALHYTGEVQGIKYQVTFRPVNNLWFWTVALEGYSREVDLVYGQDLGIAEAGAIFSNELYMSQYLGHVVCETPEHGYILCSRQNMPSSGKNPYIQQGVLGAKAVHYATDGIQFFGLSYKETNQPASLTSDLPDDTMQYEFAFTALQTEKLTLDGKHSVTFYGLFLPDHPDAVRAPEYQDILMEAYAKAVNDSANQTDGAVSFDRIRVKEEFGLPYSSPAFTKEEIESFYPKRSLEEFHNGTLLSFFTQEHAHVVTKEKELLTPRPHGTIIITPPDREDISDRLISSSQYMYGVFNSHVVLGNTDFHKFLSTPRGFLNVQKNSGQRIYVRIDGCYRLLTLSAVYEMGMNYSRWYYKLPGDLLTVTAYTAGSQADLSLEVASRRGIAYDYVITHQITLGSNEYEHEVSCTDIRDGIRFELSSEKYPGLHYDITVPGESFTVSDDRLFYENQTSYDSSFVTLALEHKASFRLMIRGYLNYEEEIRETGRSFEEEKNSVREYYQSLINHFHLEGGRDQAENLLQLNETVWWYAHNAMIHFAMPHGLEQPGGAAWGTRDICQGPMEFFLSTQNYKLVRQILLNIFAHQSIETNEWPQWFMFDRYTANAGECHGDVIFWPLKSVADYIEASGDTAILEVTLPYLDAPDTKEALITHISRCVNCIKHTRMIRDTGLITYAGGDWDDTLQPASEELKTKLVSSWTEALAYQAFTSLSEALSGTYHGLSEELGDLAAKVRSAFHSILIKDGIIAGFLECSDPCNYMLHPSDQSTGINYRLIPMTRSIIAELVDREQAVRNIETIKSNLKFPDGVRLMNRPAHYDGGVSHLFKRAEQAANVGREISLQYTHAHIRYIEALAKLGDGKEAWASLFNINPIRIRRHVPNAGIRQSNLYFSSSDGAFHNRYEYDSNFDLLKSGDIEVKGGWRLYSSGPGIYFRQLVGNVLGIRFCKEGLIIDPVLPKELDGVTFTYECFGRTIRFTYRIADGYSTSAECSSKEIPYTRLNNPYRTGGILIREEDLIACGGQITVYTN